MTSDLNKNCKARLEREAAWGVSCLPGLQSLDLICSVIEGSGMLGSDSRSTQSIVWKVDWGRRNPEMPGTPSEK